MYNIIIMAQILEGIQFAQKGIDTAEKLYDTAARIHERIATSDLVPPKIRSAIGASHYYKPLQPNSYSSPGIGRTGGGKRPLRSFRNLSKNKPQPKPRPSFKKSPRRKKYKKK